MQQKAFKMKLFKGYEAEYKRRHDLIWPEITLLLKQAGVKEYAIFLDDATGDLFGYLCVEEEDRLNTLGGHFIMQKWWAYMKDIMETQYDNSPVMVPLKQVFYMQ